MTDTLPFDSWLSGIATVEEDHVFTPVGQESARMAELLAQRERLLDGPEDAPEDAEAPEEERSLGEEAKTYAQRRDELDQAIEEQLAIDHPEAMRARIKGLSDVDVEEVQNEISELAKAAPEEWPNTRQLIEFNIRMVARAFVAPEATPDDIRRLRGALNQGEWARLLDHTNRLQHRQAEDVDLPK